MKMKKTLCLACLSVGIIAGCMADWFFVSRERKKLLRDANDKLQKFREFYHVMVPWLEMKISGKSFEAFFEQHNYKTVAVYGIKELGRLLVEEMSHYPSVDLRYCIDQNADQIYMPVDLYRPDEQLEDVDVVIVTAIHYYDEIKTNLKEKMSCPIISVEDIFLCMDFV